MGIFESEKNTPEQNEVQEKKDATKIDKPIESFQMKETSQVDIIKIYFNILYIF